LQILQDRTFKLAQINNEEAEIQILTARRSSVETWLAAIFTVTWPANGDSMAATEGKNLWLKLIKSE
jgi:hypothetical protein